MTPEGVASVIIFVTVDCPISNSYAPEIQSIFGDYGDQPLDFYLVHVDPDVTVEAARSHAADFGLSCATALSPHQPQTPLRPPRRSESPGFHAVVERP